jgi:hypothetical protein
LDFPPVRDPGKNNRTSQDLIETGVAAREKKSQNLGTTARETIKTRQIKKFK